MTREQWVQRLSSAQTLDEWETAVDELEREFGGYPAWYGLDIIESGVADTVSRRFGLPGRMWVVPGDRL